MNSMKSQEGSKKARDGQKQKGTDCREEEKDEAIEKLQSPVENLD